jgi:hypothetical protein
MLIVPLTSYERATGSKPNENETKRNISLQQSRLAVPRGN